MLYTEKCVMNMLQLSQSSKLSKDKKKKKRDPLTKEPLDESERGE